MFTIPCHSRSGGIVGMHYFSQMSWPVGLFFFSQLPNHLHNGLMWSLYQPICLWVVWHGPRFLHTKEPTHPINDAAHKYSTPVAQEPGWGSKGWDVDLIQELGDCFRCLVWGHIHHNMLCEMVLKHQDVGDLRQPIQLQGHLYASNIYMQEVHRSSGQNQV